MPTLAPSAVLSITDAASQLQSDPLLINRAICLGLLKAAQMGKGGQWAITSDNLVAYVNAGAPGFTPPPLTPDNGMFNPDDTWAASQFVNALMTAFGEQNPTVETVQQWYDTNPQRRFEIPIAPSSVQSVILAPCPKSPLPGKPAPRFPNWGACYLVSAWRNTAAGMGARTPADLYDPTRFKSTIDAAWAKLMETSIGATANKLITVKDKRGQGQHVSTGFSLPLSGIAALVPRSTVEPLAW